MTTYKTEFKQFILKSDYFSNNLISHFGGKMLNSDIFLPHVA